MIIAELAIYPLGEGTSVSTYVKKALKALEETELEVRPGPMCTVLEAENLSEIFQAVEKAHEAMEKEGAGRIMIDLKIDHRRDKKSSAEDKLKSIGKD